MVIIHVLVVEDVFEFGAIGALFDVHGIVANQTGTTCQAPEDA